MKKNIMHIITKLELGGAQQNTLYSVLKHDRSKYNVYLVSGMEGFLTDKAKQLKDVKVILLPELRHEISPINDLKCLFALKKIFKKEKIDLVHTHSSKAGILGRFAAKLAGVRMIIHTVHGFSFNDVQSALKKRFYIFFERLAAKYTDKLIVVTRVDIEKGLQAGVGEAGQYVLIRSGFDIAEFTAPRDVIETRKELGIAKDLKVVGMVACFKEQKSPLDFIRMAGLVKQKYAGVKFLLVGDGVLRPEIEKLIEEKNLKNDIILTGWREDVPRLLHAMDVFVLTSRWEGLPRVLPQAMCAKKPLVATAVDGSKEAVLDGKNGYLVSPGDCPAIAARVIELLLDEEMRKRMGEAGFSMVKAWDQDEMVRQIEELYLQVQSTKEKVQGTRYKVQS